MSPLKTLKLPDLKVLTEAISMRPLMGGAMWAAHQILRVRGFKWEVRRNGELKIGLWRKTFREKTLRKPHPKRLVFVPGFGDTPLSWLSVLTLVEPILWKNFDEVVLIDIPGYNGLLAHENFFQSVDIAMDAIFDVLDSLKPHTVMGHSLGGFTAAHYAAACSTGKRMTGRKQNHCELQSIVVIDPSGVFESDLDRQEWQSKIQGLVDNQPEKWRPFIFAKEPFWFRAVGAQFLKFGARAEIGAFIASGRDEHEVQRILPLIQTEVSIIWGEKDTLIPSSFASSWLKYLTNAKGKPQAAIVRNVGHSPQVEAPAVVAAILGQILSGRQPHPMGKRWYRLIESQV
jgi:pimeloyl-ACP methyl ester carboxylesterase